MTTETQTNPADTQTNSATNPSQASKASSELAMSSTTEAQAFSAYASSTDENSVQKTTSSSLAATTPTATFTETAQEEAGVSQEEEHDHGLPPLDVQTEVADNGVEKNSDAKAARDIRDMVHVNAQKYCEGVCGFTKSRTHKDTVEEAMQHLNGELNSPASDQEEVNEMLNQVEQFITGIQRSTQEKGLKPGKAMSQCLHAIKDSIQVLALDESQGCSEMFTNQVNEKLYQPIERLISQPSHSLSQNSGVSAITSSEADNDENDLHLAGSNSPTK